MDFSMCFGKERIFMITTEKIFDLQRFANIENSTSNTLISGTSEADSITNYAYGATINTGDGDNTVRNIRNDAYNSDSALSAFNVSINTGAGNDSVANGGFYCTINTGAGDDSISNGGRYATINAGSGNDSVYNSNNDCTINTG